MYNELYHHGIKGMRWGVRRTPAQLGHRKGDSSVTKKVKNDYNSMSNKEFKSKYQVSKKRYAKRVEKYGDPYMNSPLAKAGKKLSAVNKQRTQRKSEIAPRKDALKNRRNLSDAELRDRINRLKMEKEFKQLTNEDIAPGKKYAAEILSSAGKKTLTVAAAGAMAYGVKAVMTKEFNIKEAANYVAANPNKKK